MSGFSYFPGCSLHATAREYDESIRAVAGLLGLELREIEDWCCCGATPAHALDPEAARILGFWNLAHAAKGGRDPVLTGCASCFSRLRAARERDARASGSCRAGRREDRPAARSRDRGPAHRAGPGVARDAGEDQRRAQAAAQGPQGRLLLRLPLDPPARARMPSMTARTRRSSRTWFVWRGREPIDWPLRLDCCGASMALPRPDVVRDLSGKILVMAHERGAQVLHGGLPALPLQPRLPAGCDPARAGHYLPDSGALPDAADRARAGHRPRPSGPASVTSCR